MEAFLAEFLHPCGSGPVPEGDVGFRGCTRSAQNEEVAEELGEWEAA